MCSVALQNMQLPRFFFVSPKLINQSKQKGVDVCAVVGFPLGATLSSVKAYEAAQCIAEGAKEIDMVINVGALLSGNVELVKKDIEAVSLL